MTVSHGRRVGIWFGVWFGNGDFCFSFGFQEGAWRIILLLRNLRRRKWKMMGGIYAFGGCHGDLGSEYYFVVFGREREEWKKNACATPTGINPVIVAKLVVINKGKLLHVRVFL